MEAVEDIVSKYCAAWNEPSGEAREELLNQIANPELVYVDPAVEIIGVSALSLHIEAVQLRYPGSQIVRLSKADFHHWLCRFAWQKVLADGVRLAPSIDICEFGPDLRLKRVIGFFGVLD